MSDLVTPCLTGRVKDNRTKGDLVKEDYSRWLEPSNAQAVELPAWDMGGRQFKAAALYCKVPDIILNIYWTS